MAGLTDDLELAQQLADAADEITLARFRSADLVVDTKPDMTPVSEADRAVEQRIRELVAARRPGDAIFGEEFGGEASADRRWIVDPIDGTKGYVRGMPVWATLLALEQHGAIVASVVSAPAMGRRWWATAGGGAWVGGALGGGALGGGSEQPQPLKVSAVTRLDDAQACYGDVDWFQRTGRIDGLLELTRRCWRSRGFGDFWQYMLVAEGQAEIASDPAVELWDLAAPMLIVQEAGGTFTDFAGAATADGGDAIASNGLLHDAARAVLTS